MTSDELVDHLCRGFAAIESLGYRVETARLSQDAQQVGVGAIQGVWGSSDRDLWGALVTPLEGAGVRFELVGEEGAGLRMTVSGGVGTLSGA